MDRVRQGAEGLTYIIDVGINLRAAQATVRDDKGARRYQLHGRGYRQPSSLDLLVSPREAAMPHRDDAKPHCCCQCEAWPVPGGDMGQPGSCASSLLMKEHTSRFGSMRRLLEETAFALSQILC